MLQKLFRDVRQMLFSCTDAEAANLGFFLNEMLERVASWRKSRKARAAERRGVWALT